MKLRLRSDLPNGGERRVGERLGETGILRNICIYIYIYSVCFFFIELKVFVNLTYLYLSEIKKARSHFLRRNGSFDNLPKNLDLDRGFLSKPVFLLYACRASVEL